VGKHYKFNGGDCYIAEQFEPDLVCMMVSFFFSFLSIAILFCFNCELRLEHIGIDRVILLHKLQNEFLLKNK